MVATENDDMASSTYVNTWQMNHPEMSKISKRDDVCKLFCYPKKFNYSTELSFTTEFQ